MELKFIAARQPDAVNTAIQRRQRLVRRLVQQVDLIRNAIDGVLPRMSLVWMGEGDADSAHRGY